MKSKIRNSPVSLILIPEGAHGDVTRSSIDALFHLSHDLGLQGTKGSEASQAFQARIKAYPAASAESIITGKLVLRPYHITKLK